MKCILDGHEPQLYNGHGPYKGGLFWVCIHCGRTEPQIVGRAPNMPTTSSFNRERAEANPIEVH